MLPVHPAADLFPLLEGAELDALAADIREHGLLDPVVVYKGRLLDGRNRWRACELAGVPVRTREWTGIGSPTAWVISVNLQRRHLTTTQRAVVAVNAMPMFAAEAAARQEATRAKPGEQVRQAPERLPEPTAKARVEARDEAGAIAGVSGRTVFKAAKIAASTPDVYDAMRTGAIKIEQAVVLAKLPEVQRAPLIAEIRAAPTVDRREQIAKQVTQGAKERHKANVVEEIKARPAPPAAGPFGVIVIDPPWAYEKRVGDASHRARLDYPDMTINEICALPVPVLAEPDCILWLWTTNAFMRQAFVCLDAWGFGEKTILTWAKSSMVLGDWLRGITEHCILAVRGHPVVNLTNQTTLLNAPRREHSRKPDEFYALVESLCPGSKLEMFAREPRSGWVRWGAETERFAI